MGGISWADFNNDNFLDIGITGFINEDPWYITKIYENNQDETFTELAGTNLPGMNYGKIKWADYNNDTYQDFILTGYGDDFYTEIYKNNGDETFSVSGISLHQGWLGDVEWADYNNDNKIDLVISGTGGDGTERYTKIYKNNGSGSFTETSDILTGVSHSSLEWADFDNDGDLDLYISGTPGDPGSGNYVSEVYLNDDNSFSLGTSFAPNYWGDAKVCDYNNDNLPDIVISGYDNSENVFSAIYKNTTPVSITFIEKNISISPIPAKNFIKIESDDIINNVEMFNITGKLVLSERQNTKNAVVNIETLKSGVYFIKTFTNKQNNTQQIVIK